MVVSEISSVGRGVNREGLTPSSRYAGERAGERGAVRVESVTVRLVVRR
jgi:hypothetical protein